MRPLTLMLLGWCFTFSFLWAQALHPMEFPRVFLLGENEQSYEKLSALYKKSLLETCNDDIDVAFYNWLNMLKAMESYAEKISFDIKGVKLWIHVFWNEEGNIDHIGYYLRPNSRNILTEDLSAFFSSFMRHYQFPVSGKNTYSHYTSVSFPIYSSLNPNKE